MEFQEVAPGVFVRKGDDAPDSLVEFAQIEVESWGPDCSVYLAGPNPVEVTVFRIDMDPEGVETKSVRVLKSDQSWSLLDPETGQNETMSYFWLHPETDEWEYSE